MEKILFLGDSLTDCERLYSPDGLGEGYVKLLSKRLPYRLVNRGFNGFTAADVNRQLNIFLQDSPEYISLLVGVNDVPSVLGDTNTAFNRFSKSYESILQGLSAYRDNTLIIIPFIFTTPAEFILWRKILGVMNNEIKRLCKKHSFKNILDMEAVFAEEASARGEAALTVDGIHLTETGHEILAENWLKAFKNITEK
ncbi:MAG: GDSL-type esterase/lipase family protein [Clostridiales bacterium]|nr:GDSL-type esterase/lipase family protein [Clostridiales bacterium]